MDYEPSNWYWIVADTNPETQAFSSASASFASVGDAAHQAWLASGGSPTRIATFSDLKDVLRRAGIPPYASVTMLQGRLALLQAGLLDQTNAAVAASTPDVQLMWEYAEKLDRENPALLKLAHALNLTDTALDHLFVIAASL